MKRIALIAILALTVGCKTQAYQTHPGAAGYVSGAPTATQLFASQAYDALTAADAVIQATRADFLANKFPASAMPTIRTAFNTTVAAYDTAQRVWLEYNQAAASGASPSQDALAAAVAGMNATISELTALRGGR